MTSVNPIALLVCVMAIAFTLHGCGNGSSPTPGPPGPPGPTPTPTPPPGPPSPSPTPPTPTPPPPDTKCGLAQGQCSQCLDGKCKSCNSGYVLDDSTPGGRCVASCVGQAPPKKPAKPDSVFDLKGKAWPQMCLNKTNAHFFGIGDWGGTGPSGNTWPNPGKCGSKQRPCTDADNRAQFFVARQMLRVAPTSDPDYVINAGDNFYPGGVTVGCNQSGRTGQWSTQFDNVYNKPDSPIKSIPWHSVLGNHDYGGNHYDSGWDSQIRETWNRDNWIMPAQYWSRKVQYLDFSVDYFFLDSNYQDAHSARPDTCICTGTRECYSMHDKESCVTYLDEVYAESRTMLEEGLQKSTAEWHIVVTHFPAISFIGDPFFQGLNEKYGIDLFITGHQHDQADGNSHDMQWIVTGGGGGVTSDVPPDYPGGHDDAYGFIDFAINRTQLRYDMHTWGGAKTPEGDIIIRKSVVVNAREKKVVSEELFV